LWLCIYFIINGISLGVLREVLKKDKLENEKLEEL
jgi:hypothetical protein